MVLNKNPENPNALMQMYSSIIRKKHYIQLCIQGNLLELIHLTINTL